MSHEVIITESAQKDLAGIFEYIAFTLLEPETAANLYRAVINAIHTLDTFPERNPLVESEPWHKKGLRKMPVKRFVVFYDISGVSVRILRIMYHARDIEKQLSALPGDDS